MPPRSILRCASWLLFAVVGSLAAEEDQVLLFRRWEINPASQFSACAAVDVNRDGRLDIYCGDSWYESPGWVRHKTRDVPMIRGRYDDYSNLPLDVNRDGWTDIISVNYRSKSLFWIEHPGDTGSQWQAHEIDNPGPSETGRLVDVDGNGFLDVLPNGADFAAWYEQLFSASDSKVTVHWIRHDLPEEIIAHGIGFGDIDRDGHGDLVSPKGWLRAFRDRDIERWQWMPEFRLHADASIPILVEDVDADGDTDLIWGRGHNIGLYWLEQITEDEGRRWVRHPIDTSWSAAHAPMLVDLDGDGRQDLVAGKRFLGHDGKDPGEYDPLVIYWYRFDLQTRAWQRSPISWGAGCGFDLDPKAVDLDADGDVDIVAPTRAGLYWLENLGYGAPDSALRSMLPPELPQQSSRASLLTLAETAGGSHPVQNGLDWGFRRAQILQQLQLVMGPLPSPGRRVPLNVEYTSREETEHYVRHHITYQSEAGDRVPAYLLVPHQRSHPAPAVLCLHPTSPLGKDQVCGLGGEPSRFYAHELAERGFVCLAPDYPSFGEYGYDFAAAPGEYRSGTMKAIWNNVRAVDLLESLEEVDADRIACIGHSLGGHNGLFTAALDQRIRAVVTSCGFNAFEDYSGGDLTGWSSARYMPTIQTDYGADPRRMPFDFHEVLAAIAPRPVFVSAPLHDANFPVEGVRKVIDRVQPVYDLLDAGNRLHVAYPNAEHDFPDEIREQAYEWLENVLTKKAGR